MGNNSVKPDKARVILILNRKKRLIKHIKDKPKNTPLTFENFWQIKVSTL